MTIFYKKCPFPTCGEVTKKGKPCKTHQQQTKHLHQQHEKSQVKLMRGWR